MAENENEVRVSWGETCVRVPREGTYLDAKKALSWKNDVLMVLSREEPRELRSEIQGDCDVIPLTFDDERARWALRHTAAHVLAQAVKRLYPGVRLGIGPAIDDGFYYDFDLESPFVPEDLEKIESEIKKIISENIPVVRQEVDRETAKKMFQDMGEPYKVELIDELPEGSAISLYRQGDFVDLCAGPHVPSTGYLKAVKLLSFAGAYWRGDEKRPMLQRIYGTAFMSRDDLKQYLDKLEEIKKRDHRRLARDLDLFSIQEEGGPGLVYWHAKGALIRELIEDFWRKEHRKRGYDIVYSPHIAKLDLWKKSGHWNWYKESMYAPMAIEEVEYMLKPMNCPFHILMFKNQTRSYRELPMRMGELGTVYRYERSGVLHGALRVRGFTQDDAHIFCTREQLEDELVEVLELAQFMLATFGYKEYECMLSIRDPENKSKYVGDDDSWTLAQSALEQALKRKELPYAVDEGEAKFYGPAIDIKIKDALGRLWQGPTVQVDFNNPERFDVVYVGEDGLRHQPVMIHRTVLGSMERFVAGLVEHYGGAFPLWLSPTQVTVIPVADKMADYAEKVAAALRDEGFRVNCDLGREKMGHKIRQAQLEKVPYMLVVGAREEEDGTVSVRHRAGGDLGAMSLGAFLAQAKEELDTRSLERLVKP